MKSSGYRTRFRFSRAQRTTAVVLVLLVMASCSGDDAAETSTTQLAPTTTAPDTSTTASTTTSSSTTSSTTTTTMVPPAVLDPAVEAGYPEEAGRIAVLYDIDRFGIVESESPRWWWDAFAQDEPEYLAGYVDLSVGPDGAIWGSRLRRQAELCTVLTLDLNRFAEPGLGTTMASLPTVDQPNCRPDQPRWPAGYLDSFAATPDGLLLFLQDQFPRDDCDLINCIPDKVLTAEVRPYDAIDEVGRQIQIYRAPLNRDGLDAEGQAIIPFPAVRVVGQSGDGGVVGLRFEDGTGALFDLATFDLIPVPEYAIPTWDGDGYLYATSSGNFPEIEGTLIEVRPGRPERPLFTTTLSGIVPLADLPGHIALGLVQDENIALHLYDREAETLSFTGVQGLPGPQVARVVPAN